MMKAVRSILFPAGGFMFSLLMMFASLFCQAASMGTYTVTTSYAHVNHIPDCVAGKHNCWHTGNVMLASIASGQFVFGLNSSNQVLKYSDYPGNSWAVQSGLGTSMTSLAVAGATLYALGNASQCTGSSGGSKMYMSIAPYTSWTQIGNCDWGAIAGSTDGTLVAVANYGSTNGCAYSYSGTAYNFTEIGSSCTWKQMVPVSSAITLGINASGTLNICLVTVGNCATYAGPSGVTLSALTTDSASNVYVLGSGTVYHANIFDSLTAPAWDTIAGSNFTSIAGGGSNNTWAVGATSGSANTYRFPDQTRQLSRNLSGPPVPMCAYHGCPGVTHNATTTAGWKGSYTGTTGHALYNPALSLNITSTANLDDPFSCFEAGSDCTPTSTGNVFCSEENTNDWTDPGISDDKALGYYWSVEMWTGQ